MKRSINILISDRNPNVRRLLHREMAAQGYGVIIAQNDTELMKILDHEKIDLLILDPELVYGEGTSLITMMRKKAPDLPIIVHSFSNRDDQEKDPIVGAVFIEKGSMSVEMIKQEATRILNL